MFMKKRLINEILNIQKIMGLLNEDMELSSQSSDLSKVQNLLDLHNLDIKAKDVLDNTEPICVPPKKYSEEENKIISSFWEIANKPSNKNQLKEIFKTIKNILYSNDNINGEVSIGGLKIDKDNIHNVGKTLLTICVVGMINKTTDCNKG